MRGTETSIELARRFERELAECYALTGAEPSGVDRMDAEHAVEEVSRMREELDALCEFCCAVEDLVNGRIAAER